MMRVNFKAVFSIFLLIVTVGIFIIAYKDHIKNENLLKTYGEYQTCTVTKMQRTYRAKMYVYYEFTAKGIIYRDSRLYYPSDGDIQIGGKYKVVYYPKNPKINKLLYKRDLGNY